MGIMRQSWSHAVTINNLTQAVARPDQIVHMRPAPFRNFN